MEELQSGGILICIKSLTDLGYEDFKKGNIYRIDSVDEAEKEIYIISEDGSSCLFGFDELNTYFN